MSRPSGLVRVCWRLPWPRDHPLHDACLGFVVTTPADPQEIIINHKVSADNRFLFVVTACMAQTMMDVLTAVLLTDWGLAWKPSSLQAFSVVYPRITNPRSQD